MCKFDVQGAPGTFQAGKRAQQEGKGIQAALAGARAMPHTRPACCGS